MTSRALLLLVLVCCAVVDAGVLTPYEQTIGQWNVSLRCAANEVSAMLFPSREQAATKQKRVHCHLDIFPNGTFCMDASQDRMPVRGEWKLKPNPYCITDRQYDQLVLESYPRVQKRIIADNEEEEVLQRVKLQLQCRVWGRYGSDPIRRFVGYQTGRSMARMTHGTLLWNVQESQQINISRWKSRCICATFTARPIEAIPQHDDPEDL
jgi:hypothetical protein